MNCDIIKDLLPLYAEGLASPESRELVEEHLKDCPACSETLKELQANLPAAQQAALPLEKISRQIKKRRLLTGLLAMFLVLAFAAAALSALTAPQFAPYQEGLFEIHQQGDSLVVTVRRGYRARLIPFPWASQEDQSLQTFDLEVFSYPFDRTGGQGELKLTESLDPDSRAVVFYLEPGREDRLVFGPDPNPNGGRWTMPRLALAYYLVLALGLALILGLLLLIFRKKEKARRVIRLLLGLPLSWLAGHLLIKGFHTVSWEMLKDFVFILLTGCFLFGAWVIRLWFMPGREKPAA